jgi:uncharacterized GH25 family protein
VLYELLINDLIDKGQAKPALWANTAIIVTTDEEAAVSTIPAKSKTWTFSVTALVFRYWSYRLMQRKGT